MPVELAPLNFTRDWQMINNDTHLIGAAEQQLALMTACDYQELDLPCPIETLNKSDWQIVYDNELAHYTVPIYELRVDYSQKDQVVAYYAIYLSEQLVFIDEFFVTH